ncbi:MAG: hypothetical protein IJ039_01065 [Clostridia bacterium]|nr:hypothetical protein [Clostridia bacterium]
MILLFDNNQYRRHDILLSLFMKKYIVAEQPLDDMDFYTKPFMTVYLNPTEAQMKKIKKEDTLCVVAKNNVIGKTPDWMEIIPLDKNTAKSIMKIYDEKCPFGKGREIFGALAMEGKRFAFGGIYFHLTPKQMKAIKILLYNPHKKFELYDISSYLEFNTDKEIGFSTMIDEINMRCKKVNREKLVLREGSRYYINPNIIFYKRNSHIE